MPENYDDTIARYYAAYRPPLHQKILKRALSGRGQFPAGLDIGCGTGRSAIALVDHCDHVHAIDPSQSMLDRATKHSAITYLAGEGERIPMPDRSVDIVTLAGSLFYADRFQTAAEVSRVCHGQSLIVPYDFTVQFGEALNSLGISASPTDSGYDPTVNFSDCSQFEELDSVCDCIVFEVRPSDIAYVLLSDQTLHNEFVDRYDNREPHAALTHELRSVQSTPALSADIFYSVYRLKRSRCD